MTRPKRCRKVCCLPKSCEFKPTGATSGDYEVIMSVDEYETIRLIDREGFTQDECGKYMKVARTTVQEIYSNARFKIATALVDAKPLKIEGGDYVLCDGEEKICRCGGCSKHKIYSKMNSIKGDLTMKIAVAYDNGEIFQHFGHTETFKIYEVSENAVINSEVVPTLGSGHGALAGFLKDRGVNVLICGGIGGGAKMALEEAGIKLFGGVCGNADEAVSALLNNNLEYNPNVKCEYHEHEDGGEEHHCFEHGCGNGSCNNN